MKTALLVIDLQKFFSDMVSRQVMENIVALVEEFRAEKDISQATLPLTIFTQHGHTEKERRTHPSPSQLVRKWGIENSIWAGSKDWEFMPRIQGLVGDAKVVSSSSSDEADVKSSTLIIPKTTYDAFIHTGLEEVLRLRGIERVVVCGVMTDCCVDTTARGAFNRGFETWVVEDACASANKRQHQAGLVGFGYAFGEVLSTEEVLERLDAERA
ncbi:Isochorismatase-like protein [Naviculisporaceae sp. PSN 640]